MNPVELLPAFEAAGRMSEESLALCDAAADLEDEKLSEAADRARHWINLAGQRIAELRKTAREQAAAQ
jgi:hypothetical protein